MANMYQSKPFQRNLYSFFQFGETICLIVAGECEMKKKIVKMALELVLEMIHTHTKTQKNKHTPRARM